MADAAALKAAIQLHHAPASVRVVRSNPLPGGMFQLLQVATGDPGALREAANLTERSPESLQTAACFYVEQVLWHPEADSFRVLGASPASDAGDLKRNMTVLMSWLHPDSGGGNERSAFAVRVTNAWNDLKTPERRRQYATDLARQREQQAVRRRRLARREAQRRRLLTADVRGGFLKRLFVSFGLIR